MSVRFWAALWLAKLSRPLLRITRHNGTDYPGRLALKVCPDFLHFIGKPASILAVTGTNGKTTACNIMCDMLEADGRQVLHNRLGSNTGSGICTALLAGCTVLNRPRFDLAVLEVDERCSPLIFPHLKPDHILITNLSRDSVPRNAHPQYIADLMSACIPPESRLILNGDDPVLMSVAPGNIRVYFGIERMQSEGSQVVNRCNDVQICPVCAGKLEYEFRRYHHIGRVRCTRCSFRSADCDYAASGVSFENMTMTVSDKGGSGQYPLLVDNLFNTYDQTAAITLLRELGYEHGRIASLMGSAKVPATRYQAQKVGNINLIMQMAKEKNAVADSVVFDYISKQPGKKELLIMNSPIESLYQPENVCWLYDCDFEFLARKGIEHIVVAGARAKDYRLRLLLAGVPDERIDCDPDALSAAEQLQLIPGQTVYVLYGTAFLPLSCKVRDKIIRLIQEQMK